MPRGGAFCGVVHIQTPRCMVGIVASKQFHRCATSPTETDDMIIRKPLFLALALTLAAPLAFAQSSYPQSATPQSTDSQAAPQTTAPTTQTQSTTTQSTSTTEQPTGTQGEAAQSNDAWSKDKDKSTAATPSSSAEPQKKNWSDLDTDKNGTLSVTEAAAVQSLAKAFTEADANADGQLTQDEYKAYLAANGKAATPRSGG